ncbi:LysR family transcriptional regulator [Paenibacillus whitsoniae]|uniref:LysR family transcriptional regulator n=1 Tax=Paenibacillus whitsoniae TaxID=2496558 RepID=A0A430JIF6_9BACL|nr:LysR family transcriptional regulator [Paenibacillus whitsoniae]RTE10756.1 LysR family transcriptional regulator [Paenibacillus whitsoniae]
MDLRNLRYILEVVKWQNVTKAAEQLHITQPTLSKIIKNLEDELGVILFDRSGKSIQLTDSGNVAVRHFQSMLRAMDELNVDLEAVANLKVGKLIIGLPPVISSVFFPKIVATFQQHYPNIEFQIIEEGAKKIEHLIREGHLDLGFVVAPVNEDTFETMPLIQQQLGLVVHQHHRLAGREQVSLRELRDEKFIGFPKEYAVREHIVKACRAEGFEPRMIYESSQWDLQAEMVAERLGITIMPEAVCKKIANKHVRVISLHDPVLPWHLLMVWRKEEYLSYAMREFMTFVQAAADEFLP